VESRGVPVVAHKPLRVRPSPVLDRKVLATVADGFMSPDALWRVTHHELLTKRVGADLLQAHAARCREEPPGGVA
jgi:hypothetical protein